MANSNNKVVPGVEQALEKMKFEIAAELGIELGADTTSRQNGSVGGLITQRLVAFAQQSLATGRR